MEKIRDTACGFSSVFTINSLDETPQTPTPTCCVDVVWEKNPPQLLRSIIFFRRKYVDDHIITRIYLVRTVFFLEISILNTIQFFTRYVLRVRWEKECGSYDVPVTHISRTYVFCLVLLLVSTAATTWASSRRRSSPSTPTPATAATNKPRRYSWSSSSSSSSYNSVQSAWAGRQVTQDSFKLGGNRWQHSLGWKCKECSFVI